jgi:hypothetical protein
MMSTWAAPAPAVVWTLSCSGHQAAAHSQQQQQQGMTAGQSHRVQQGPLQQRQQQQQQQLGMRVVQGAAGSTRGAADPSQKALRFINLYQ